MSKSDDNSSDEGSTSLEIGASLEGASLKATGVSWVAVGSKISDFVSPVTEATGWLGDYVRALRVSNIKSLEASLERAAELNAQKQLNRPRISLKEFQSWAEGASLEDQGDVENISELWARILSSEMSEGDGSILSYSRILKNISPIDAKRFFDFMKDASKAVVKNGFDFEYEDVVSMNGAFSASQLAGLVRQVSELDDDGVISCESVSSDTMLCDSLVAFRLNDLGRAVKSCYGTIDEESSFFDLIVSIRRLQPLGLFVMRSAHRADSNVNVSTTFLEPTALSFDLFDAIKEEG